MGKRQPAERKYEVGKVAGGLEMSVGAANQKAEFGTAVEHPGLDFTSEFHRLQIFAALVKDNDFCSVGYGRL